jgi:hypothetical protein
MLNADDTVSAAFLADLFGVTGQTIARLAREGVLEREGRGRYPLRGAVQGYMRHRVASEAARHVEGSADRVRDARAAEIERRLQIQDRKIITMDEATGCVDEIIGAFITVLSTLPARITNNRAERQRIETIIDAERARLSGKFDEISKRLATGQAEEVEAD